MHYNGHLVLKRGHVPMLNVEYEPGGCGCYRDWQDQQVVFQADNVITQGVYAEPDVAAETVCDTGGSGGDIGSFNGVSAEKFADPLVLTTQFEAGWYRYTMKWKFYMDGRIQPVFGFAAIDASCVSYTHRHHAYWRLDFDIDNPENDIVTEAAAPPPGGGGGGRPGPRPQVQVLQTEAKRVNNQPNLTWTVTDSATHRGYRIVPGEETELAADDFSIGDLWALAYHANEIDDGHDIGDCPVDVRPVAQRRTAARRRRRLVPHGSEPPRRRPGRLPRRRADPRADRELECRGRTALRNAHSPELRRAWNVENPRENSARTGVTLGRSA